METIVQNSLDLTSIPEALETARWLEAGRPLIICTPEFGAPLVVLGAPFTIDANAFRTASGNREDRLRLVCEKVHDYRT
jgi:hypothetical protein